MNEVKNSIGNTKSRMDQVEERIYKVEDRTLRLSSWKRKTTSKNNNNEFFKKVREHLWTIEDHQRNNMQIIGVLEGEEREKGAESLFR